MGRVIKILPYFRQFTFDYLLDVVHTYEYSHFSQIRANIQNKHERYYDGQNLVAFIVGDAVARCSVTNWRASTPMERKERGQRSAAQRTSLIGRERETERRPPRGPLEEDGGWRSQQIPTTAYTRARWRYKALDALTFTIKLFKKNEAKQKSSPMQKSAKFESRNLVSRVPIHKSPTGKGALEIRRLHA